jgi:hypothetical protein
LYWLPQIPHSSRNCFLKNSFTLNKDEGLCESLKVMLCKFLMIYIIQIDAGLLAYHDQLSWLACHWILNIWYVEFNNNFIHRNTTNKPVFVPIIILMAPSRLRYNPTAEERWLLDSILQNEVSVYPNAKLNPNTNPNLNPNLNPNPNLF